MSARSALARLRAAALTAGAVSAEVATSGGRHGVVLVVSLPGGGGFRYPVPTKIAHDRGWRNARNCEADLRRLVRAAVEEGQ